MINIDATNINQAGGFGVNAASDNNASINISDNKKSGAANQTTFAGVVVSGSGVSSKAMDENTYKSVLEEAEDIKSQIMQSATDAKMNLKNLMNRLSGADAVKIDEDGFNLNDLSDEDCVNIVDRIKIELAAYNDNYRDFASDVDIDKIRQVLGSEGFAQEVAGQFNDSGVPVTDANLKAVADAADKLNDITVNSETPENYQPSMGAKLYMAANDADVTLDNVQIAEHAYRTRGDAISENDWNELKSQVENVLERAGLPANDSNLNNAKALLSEDMPVTEENLKKMAAIDDTDFSAENVIKKTIDAIAQGTQPENAVLTQTSDEYADVVQALNTLDKIENNISVCVTIAQSTSRNGLVSLTSLNAAYEIYIANPSEYMTDGADITAQEVLANETDSDGEAGSDGANSGKSGYGSSQGSTSTVSYVKMLTQIQILMTAESGLKLEKNGLNINTVSITTLHENLLALDKEEFMDELGEQLAHDIDTDEAYSTVYNTREALYNIEKSPLDMVGALYKEIMAEGGSAGVISVMSASKTGISLKERFSRAGEAYETMSGTVRADLGDSLNRAVEASAGATLNGLGLEDNEKNREALGILVRNNMDVTKGNVTNVKELKSTLDSLVSNMTPQTALDMIRNNVNPYTTDIREVNEYLKAQNEENGADKDEKYSAFLYKLDRTDGITADERRQFIGIYKMMNMFTKDAGGAVGALVAQGADITMENLVSAYNSRRSYNRMDMSVSDDSGINVSTYENYYTNLFTATGDKITPNTLKEVNTDKPIYERSVENFCEAADEFYDAAAEAEYLDEYMELAREIAQADSSVINELERADEDITLNNIQAMEQLMASDFFNNGLKIDKDRAKDIYDSIGDRAELNKKLQQLSDDASESLEREVDSDDNTYEVVRESSINQMAAQMMVRSARREDYTVPYLKGDGIGMMKISFKSDGEQTGKISINYEDEALGNVSLNISVTKELSMSAVYATHAPLRGSVDEQETSAADNFKEKLTGIGNAVAEQFGFAKADVIINPVRNVSRTIYDNEAENDISNAQLYRIAKAVVEGLV